jgi:CBS domain-containing protein
MNVGELLQKVGQSSVFTTKPTTSVQQALEDMASYDVSALLVIDDEDRMRGIITERDLVRKVLLPGKDPATTRIGEIMTPVADIISVSRETDVQECRRIMRQNRFRHAPVVRNEDIPDGIVSVRDLLEVD